MSSSHDELLEEVRGLILELVQEYPFYSELALQVKEIKLVLEPYALPFPVGLKMGPQGEIELLIGPKLSEVPREDRLALLHHELLHLALEHLRRGVGKERLRWWLASDLACNQLLPELPKGALTPESLGLSLPPRPGGYTAEAIYARLKELTDQQLIQALLRAIRGVTEEGGTGRAPSSSLGPHRVGVGQGRQGRSPLLTRGGVGIGTHPSSSRREAPRAPGKPLPWQKLLLPFFPKASFPLREETRKRPNRRYGFLSPGRRRTHKLRVAVALDTSGSISTEALGLFWRELEHLRGLRLLELVGVIVCDAQVHGVFNRGHQRQSGLELRGGGGTDFRPAFKRAEELSPDLFIYFTDGLGTYPPRRPKFPVIWVLDGTKPQSKIGVSWGEVIKLTR